MDVLRTVWNDSYGTQQHWDTHSAQFIVTVNTGGTTLFSVGITTVSTSCSSSAHSSDSAPGVVFVSAFAVHSSYAL